MNNQINKDTIIIIPAFNEEESIHFVLRDIPSQRVIQVIVVDNNSTDNTSQIAKDNGALVIFEARKGYGQACLTGISSAVKFNPKYIIFLDGDYSDDPKEMGLIWKSLDNGYDLVIGSRNLGKADKGALLPQAKFGNWLATNLLYLLFRGSTKFSDLGPFRGITYQALQKLNMNDRDFGWTVEMQTKAIISNLDYGEVSVSYKKRIGVSKITGTIKGTFLAGHKILYTIFTLWFRSVFVKNSNV